MFVRWKTHPATENRSPVHWAVVVESVRIGGKPKQRVVKYLASIREDHIRLARLRLLFWAKVTKEFETLSLDSDTKETIERKIEEKVSKPTEAELIHQLNHPYDLKIRAKSLRDQ